MSWHKVTFTAGQAASNEHGKLQDQFDQIFMDLGGPKDMALFSSRTFDIYFTPACSSDPGMKDLMDTYGASACKEPTRETETMSTLLVGDPVTWNEHIWHTDLS